MLSSNIIESKIAQLQEEVSKTTNVIAQLTHGVIKSQEQIKNHENHVTKLSGAIEAFTATLNALNSKASNSEQTEATASVERASNVENSGI
jgi:chromosome segregation ATPase